MSNVLGGGLNSYGHAVVHKVFFPVFNGKQASACVCEVGIHRGRRIIFITRIMSYHSNLTGWI
jgi:hypothetical protein|uniref:Uncharacterized protein n=1 Tax=Populus trichocarpa TaxID=3694 RepID=A0A3N7FH68_POPTR